MDYHLWNGKECKVAQELDEKIAPVPTELKVLCPNRQWFIVIVERYGLVEKDSVSVMGAGKYDLFNATYDPNQDPIENDYSWHNIEECKEIKA